jgi:hypothetical protein
MIFERFLFLDMLFQDILKSNTLKLKYHWYLNNYRFTSYHFISSILFQASLVISHLLQ